MSDYEWMCPKCGGVSVDIRYMGIQVGALALDCRRCKNSWLERPLDDVSRKAPPPEPKDEREPWWAAALVWILSATIIGILVLASILIHKAIFP